MSRTRWAIALAISTPCAACGDGELDAFWTLAGAGAGGTAVAEGGAAGHVAGGAGTGGETAGGAAGRAQGGTTGITVLDDFEDRNGHAPGDGWWYVEDDGTGARASVSYEEAARGESLYAARVRGGPYTAYGAFLGLDLPGPNYDASAYAELCFFGRADPPLGLSVHLLDAISHYVVNVDLGSAWQEHCLALVDFVNPDEVLDLTDLFHLQFWVRDPSQTFDFWIDDVALKP